MLKRSEEREVLAFMKEIVSKVKFSTKHPPSTHKFKAPKKKFE